MSNDGKHHFHLKEYSILQLGESDILSVTHVSGYNIVKFGSVLHTIGSFEYEKQRNFYLYFLFIYFYYLFYYYYFYFILFVLLFILFYYKIKHLRGDKLLYFLA